MGSSSGRMIAEDTGTQTRCQSKGEATAEVPCNIASIEGASGVSPSMLDALPLVLQEQIAAEVAKLGTVQMLNLQGCSKEWKGLCSDCVRLADIPADRLADAIPFLNGLAQLHSLTLTCTAMSAFEIGGVALSLLQVNLRSFSLTSGIRLEEHSAGRSSAGVGADAEQGFVMRVPDLQMLLQPWYLSLECLHFDFCNIIIPYRAVGSPGFFAMFPVLRTLQLIMSRVGPSLGTSSTNLDLSGCTALQVLDCHGSNIPFLELSGCGALTFLNCSHNKLTTLFLTQSPNIKHLQCSSNQLIGIKVSALACVHNVSCADKNDIPVFLGHTQVLELECSAYTFHRISSTMRKNLKKLTLTDALGSAELSGFCDLKFLSCSFQHSELGWADVRQCTHVELKCHCTSEFFVIVGSEQVHRLNLTKLGFLPPHLYGFSQLQHLHLTLSCEGFLFLSQCVALLTVRLTNATDQLSSLTHVNLANCCLLEELSCDNFPSLAELNLTKCMRLRSLSCTENGVTVLDVSWCPHLTSLDVSGSLLIALIVTCSSSSMLNITSNECGKLLCWQTKRDLHQSTESYLAECALQREYHTLGMVIQSDLWFVFACLVIIAIVCGIFVCHRSDMQAAWKRWFM